MPFVGGIFPKQNQSPTLEKRYIIYVSISQGHRPETGGLSGSVGHCSPVLGSQDITVDFVNFHSLQTLRPRFLPGHSSNTLHVPKDLYPPQLLLRFPFLDPFPTGTVALNFHVYSQVIKYSETQHTVSKT